MRHWKQRRHAKPATPGRELERRIAALPPMPEGERQEAIKTACRDLGLDYAGAMARARGAAAA